MKKYTNYDEIRWENREQMIDMPKDLIKCSHPISIYCFELDHKI